MASAALLSGCLGDEGAEAALAQLSQAHTEDERFYALPRASMAAYDLGDTANARKLAVELATVMPSYKSNWGYVEAIHKSNAVLGRLALQRGNVAEAKQYLIASARLPDSSQFSAFGPNMSLAQELLNAGEKEAVLEYFDLCRVFWVHDLRGSMDTWKNDVRRGRRPNFGANTLY